MFRDDRAAAGHFVAHEFRGDVIGNARAPGLAWVLCDSTTMAIRCGHQFSRPFAGLVLPDGDEFHFRRDETLFGVVHLADVPAGLGAKRLADMRKTEVRQFGVCGALAPILRGHLRKFFRILPGIDPSSPQGLQAGAHINRDVRIGIGSGGIVNRDRLIGRRAVAVGRMGRGQVDFAHRNADAGKRAFNVHLA